MSKKQKKQKRCTGHCCKNFHLPFGPDEIREHYLRWSRGGTQITKERGEHMPIYTDIHLIAPMVVHLGYFDTTNKGINPSDDHLTGVETPGHRYRCKNLDPKSGDCTIYEIRPTMCRDYPYKSDCNYIRCTSSRRAKKQTRTEVNKRRRELLAIVTEKPNG